MKLATVCMMALLVPVITSAKVSDDQIDDLEKRIVELRDEYRELKDDVIAGKISKEKAREKWATKLNDLRLEKERVMDMKVDILEKKFADHMRGKSIDAEEIREKIAEAKGKIKKKRSEYKEYKNSVSALVKSGELSKSEAKEKIRIERVRQREELRMNRNKRKAKISAEEFAKRGIEVPGGWDKMAEKERRDFRKESGFDKKKEKVLSEKEIKKRGEKRVKQFERKNFLKNRKKAN